MSEKKRTAGEFVRSWDTDVPVGRSKHAFEDLIRRYGASGFTVSEDYASRTVLVAFSILASDGETSEVRLPIKYDDVRRRLDKMPEFRTAKWRKATTNQDTWANEQAARVAWRHLLLWAEAALSAVDAGLYSLQEAFFAHTLIETPGGAKLLAVDAINTMKRLSAGARND